MKTFFYFYPYTFTTSSFSVKLCTFNVPKFINSFHTLFYAFFGFSFFNKPLYQFFFYTFYNYNKFFYPFFYSNSFFVSSKNISICGDFSTFFNRYYVFCYDFTNFSSSSFSSDFKLRHEQFFFYSMSQFFLTSCLDYTGSFDLCFCDNKAYDFFTYLTFHVYPYWCTYF